MKVGNDWLAKVVLSRAGVRAAALCFVTFSLCAQTPPPKKGGKGKGGGKTNANMKTMGRNLAKVAAQKRG